MKVYIGGNDCEEIEMLRKEEKEERLGGRKGERIEERERRGGKEGATQRQTSPDIAKTDDRLTR